jgi:hypothetical protein
VSPLGCSWATLLSSSYTHRRWVRGPQTDVASYFAGNGDRVQAMSFVFALAALFLQVFLACSAGMLADTAPAQ